MKPELLLNYKIVAEAIQRVSSGEKSYFYQYMLNPSLELSDVYFVTKIFFFLIILRFLLSGAHHPKLRKYPSLFKIICKSLTGQKNESKFCENLWYSCWHIFSLCFGVYVLKSMALSEENPGWSRLLFREFNVKWYWFPTPAEYALGNLGWPSFPMTPLNKSFYLTELAFWLSCAFFLYIETVRDDIYALLLHHNLTCFLIFISYCLSFWRIGMIILLLHDVADIVLYSAKTIYYTKKLKKMVDFLFCVFALTFFLSRLIVFPLLCIRPVLDLSKIRIWSKGVIQSHWQIPGGIILPCFLCILQMLHIFWFILIVKMILRTHAGVNVSTSGDIRSDEEDEDISSDETSSALKKSGNAALASSDDEDDQRMKLSSLPGVRATLTKREVQVPRTIERY